MPSADHRPQRSFAVLGKVARYQLAQIEARLLQIAAGAHDLLQTDAIRAEGNSADVSSAERHTGAFSRRLRGAAVEIQLSPQDAGNLGAGIAGPFASWTGPDQLVEHLERPGQVA